MGVWTDFLHGLGWSIGNGNTVRFWKDNWLLMGNSLLHNGVMDRVSDYLLDDKVQDYYNTDTGWRRDKFA